MRTRGTWFVIALLGLALVSTPLASAAQSSQGRGEQVWQGHLDREELANKEALASRQQGGQVTYRCSDITLRIYPDGTADLTNAECTITIVVTKSGVTTSTDTYVVELDALQGVPVGNMTTTQRMTKTKDYLENGQAKHRVDRFGPTPARVTLTKVGTDRLLRTANGPSGIGSVAWRLFGYAEPTPPVRPPPPPPDCDAMRLVPSTLPDGTVGVPYRQRVGADGGTAPYTLEISAGVAPDGVALSWIGELAGTPTSAGPYSFMLRATDLHECVAVRRYTIVIRARDVPPPVRPRGPGMGPYHEYAALCRMGWASALAQHSVGPADATIVDHLRMAGEHMHAANQTTFAPLQAWPNWPSYVNRLSSQIDQLNRYGDQVRGALATDLRQDAQGLINALALQMAGEVVQQTNCDSLYAALGYQMCYTQQAFQIAEVAERQGDRRLQQVATNNGQLFVGSVLRALHAMPTLPLASGRCIDLGEIGLILSGDTINAPLQTRVATHNQAVARTLEILVEQAQPQTPAPEPAAAPWLLPESCGTWKR